MRCMCIPGVIVFGIAVVFISSSYCMTTEDVVKLTQAELSDEVIINHIDAQEVVFDLTTDDIIRLKKEGVSDRVIAHMIFTKIRHKRVEVRNIQEPEDKAPPAEESAQPETTQQQPLSCPRELPRQFGTGFGTVTFQNFDERSYSIQVDEKGKFIYYYYGDLRDRLCLDKGASITMNLTEGIYRIRWVGERDVFTFCLHDGDNVKLVTTGINLEKYKAVNITIFENGVEKVTGTLKKFYEEVPSVGSTTQAPTSTTIVRERIIHEPHYIVHVQHYPIYCSYYTHYYPTARCYTIGYYSPYYYHTYTRRRCFLSPRVLFWGALGGAYYEWKRDKFWKGAAAGAVFGHLLDHMLDY